MNFSQRVNRGAVLALAVAVGTATAASAQPTQRREAPPVRPRRGERPPEARRERPPRAERPPVKAYPSHEGTVVSAGDSRLELSLDGESETTYEVAPGAFIRLNGQPAQLTDLKPQDNVKIWTTFENPLVAIGVKAVRLGRNGRERGRVLGVKVSGTPGNGVRVNAVKPDSVADRAGLRPGDYVLEVSGTKISTPAELTEAVDETEQDRVSMVVWTAGDRETIEADFGTEDERPEQDGDRRQASGWLGVATTPPEDADGARVAAIYPGGPAARAGVREGDVIVQIENTAIGGPDDVAAAVEELAPGAVVTVEVRRDGETRKLSARLVRRPAQHRPRAGAHREEDRTGTPREQRLERSVRELQRELRRLRQRVDELGGERERRRATRFDVPRAGR